MSAQFTRLTFIFPCIAGCFKLSIFYTARIIAKRTNLSMIEQYWLGLAITIGALLLSLLSIVIQATVSLFSRGTSVPLSLNSFKEDVKKTPKMLFCFFNCGTSTLELLFLLHISVHDMSISLVLLSVLISHAQIILCGVTDIFGVFKARIRVPYESTLLGGSILYLGTLMLIMHPIAGSILNAKFYILIVFSVICGCLSILTLLLTHRISLSFKSYWGGTISMCLGQSILLLIICLSIDTKLKNATCIKLLFNETKLFFLVLASTLSIIISSVILQLLGDLFGQFSTIHAYIGGQIFLITVLELSDDSTTSLYEPPYLSCTGFILFGIILVIIGSIIAWIGAWSGDVTDQKNLTPKMYSTRLSTVKFSGRFSRAITRFGRNSSTIY